ncbi:MAG: M48 family metallopeptidase, partial [Desulfuromonadales bacterium]
MMPPMKWFLLILFLIVFGFRLWLRRLNLSYLKQHGQEVPPVFAGHVDQELLKKTTAYTLANSRLQLIASVFSGIVLVLFLFGGLLAWYDGWIGQLTDSFVAHGVLFVLGLIVLQTLLDIPFSLYRTFVLEERFQFNNATPMLWVSDLLKSFLIGGLLLALVTAGCLVLVQANPNTWWVWVWIFLAVMTLLMMYLSPVLIEPLFFKFQPVQDQQLANRLKEIMARAGLQVERVQQVDASRRSGHSNAYFTGIGRVKRIVLFDTLLAQMNEDEIVAVLAHEAGHWRLGHIWKRLLMIEGVSLAGCWLAWWLPPAHLSFVGQVVLLGFLASIVGFLLQPLSSGLSRRHEWQADRFAVGLTANGNALASALVKLSTENLSNLHPHPWYAWFYYSHPPVTARVTRLVARNS